MTNEILERHAATARLIQNRLVQRIIGLQPEDIARLPLTDVARLWAEAVKVEQLATQGTDADLGFDAPEGPHALPEPMDLETTLGAMDDAGIADLTRRLAAEKRRRKGR